MNRPIAVATIGTIIGIIGGLYLKTSAILIFLMFFCIIVFIIKKYNNFNSKFKRYFKVLMKRKIVIVLICSITVASFYTKYRNLKYEIIKEKDEMNITGIIQSSYTQNKYSYSYKVRINAKLYILYVKPKKTAKEFEYGDIVKIVGDLKLPEGSRNYQGFSQKDYYKAKNIYGKIFADNIEKIGHRSSIGELANNIRSKIKNKIKNNLGETDSNILLGILIGDKNEIPDYQIEEFRDSSLIHILCVSRCTYWLFFSVD